MKVKRYVLGVTCEGCRDATLSAVYEEHPTGPWMQHQDIAPTLAALPLAVEALRSLVQDFETDYVLDGVVVGDPDKMLVRNYELAKAALEALGAAGEGADVP